MDERRDLVDREELRRRIEAAIGHSGNGEWLHGYTVGKRATLNLLDAMPAVECPRGWTRDEVLAELDAGAVVKALGTRSGAWYVLRRSDVAEWHPEAVLYDVRVVRVVRVAPEPEWVPLTQLVGHTIDGCDEAVTSPPVWTVIEGKAEWRWHTSSRSTWLPFPEGTLNLETGRVAVRPKATT